MTNTPRPHMDSRLLAALLSSAVSQLLLALLLHLFPTTTSPPPPTPNLFPLIIHLMSTTEIATLLLSSSSSSSYKKRPKTDPSLQVPPPPVDPFKVCFRMTSATFEWLAGLLEPLLDCRDPVRSPLNLSPEIRLGIGLFRLATGSTYREISRRFNVSEATSRFCTKQLCRVLCTNFRFWIAFPIQPSLQSPSSSFPNCAGIIDSTRFKIVKSNQEDEEIVAQIVVDKSTKILNIVAGFRGDKGDSRVLKLSTLYKDVQEGRILSGGSIEVKGVEVPQYLVGDGGYPLLPWLMVPFVDPSPNSCEEEFNSSVQKMRLPGLRTIASLRNWNVLNKPIEEEFKTAVAFVGACSILHNALLMREDYSALSGEMEDFSVYDQSSQYYPDDSLEESTTEKKASIIRSELAAKIREARDSNPTAC